MKTPDIVNKIIVCALLLVLASFDTYAATINFSGHLDFIETDNGGGVYSGTPLGTTFSGHIDDATANGQISNGIKLTPFDCCIAAGGLSISNDLSLSANYAALLNLLTGSSMYSAGDLIDIVDIEGDTTTPGSGRIEVGISYIFGSSTFSDSNPDNYPFESNAVQLALFFIYEEDALGNDVYAAVGQITALPLPASIWLLATGLMGLLGLPKLRALSVNTI